MRGLDLPRINLALRSQLGLQMHQGERRARIQGLVVESSLLAPMMRVMMMVILIKSPQAAVPVATAMNRGTAASEV